MNENMKFPDGTVLSGQIRISGHFCTIKNLSGSIPEDTSLIRLQTAAGAVYGKIEGYTTVYQALEDGVILSDGGSVYTEPEPAEPYVPTLAELQAAKKAEVSAACEQVIYGGITVKLPDGPEHFSLTEKDQINLFGKHLKAYATTDPLAGVCVDPRYKWVNKGCAPHVEWLGQKENPDGKGWAAGERYGKKILGILRAIIGEASAAPAVPFLVKASDLDIFPAPPFGKTGIGTFTITEVQGGWGRLKSGAGWIYLKNSAII